MRGRGRVGWWALLAILVSPTAALAQTDVSPPPAPIEVPGGIAAIARFVGHVDQDPRRFVLSLESELLGSTQSDHDWTAIPQRSDLMRFLDFIGELERRFPGEIRVGPDGAERRALERLADALGFDLQHDARQGFVVLPKGERDGEQAFRRRAAHALGLELERAGDRLDRGESWTVAIPAAGRADSPLSPQVWQALVGKPLGRDSLAVLVRDQRLGLLLEGRDHWSRETRDALDGMDLRAIYDRAPFAFRRYAPAFAIEDGRLVVPGGEAALPAWREMVGASSDTPSSLVAALLLERRAKGAYLWHALRFAPPAAIDYFLGSDDAARRGAPARRIFERLDESSGAFDGALAIEPGFATLARSLPFAGVPPRLPLPGGPGLWLEAVTGDEPPATLDQARSIAARGAARELDETELLLEVLSATADRVGSNTGPLQRFLRAVNLFARHPALYSPENVVLAARGSDAFAPAITVLDTVELRSPEVARDYLLTVARLARRDLDRPREQLVMAFQGGVEWLRSMASAGRVAPETLERELASWSAIHSRHDDAAAAAPEELAWIARLLRELPPAPDDAPGRGPLERAMLRALIADTEPQLSWGGLDYESDRPRLLAAAMVENLEFFELPAADRLVGALDAIADLARRCRDEDLEGAHRGAAELRAQLAALPAPAASLKGAAAEPSPGAGNPERGRLEALDDEILERDRARGLANLAPRVEESSRWLAADLRPFLLAPAYLVPLAWGRGSLLDDRDLVRRHRLVSEIGPVDRAWQEATVERGDSGHSGTWVCGNVATVSAALSSFALSTAQLRTGAGLDQRRAGTWFHDWTSTPWHQLTPELTGAAARTMDLGWALLGLATRETAGTRDSRALALAAPIVSRARLESVSDQPPPSLLSPAEALMVGLAALGAGARQSSGDPAIAGVAAEAAAARSALARAAALGADGRDRLRRVAPWTPALDGGSGAWPPRWPSYEAVELEGRSDALIERELLDLHLAVVDYLGRHSLPGFVGSDLIRHTIEQLVSSIELGHERDWQSVLRSVRSLDDAYFEGRFRECLRDGLYRLREP